MSGAVQDSYRIADPKDATIASLRQLVASLNVQLGQLAGRIALLEGTRSDSLDAGGNPVVNVKAGMSSQNAAATRQDLQQRSLYRSNRTDELQSTGRIRASRGVSRATLGKLPDETVTVAQLAEQEQRTGVVITLEADVDHSGTSWHDITGLEFSAAENTNYTVEATIMHTLGSTGSGIALSCHGPSGATMSFYWSVPSATNAIVSRSFSDYDTSAASGTSPAGEVTARLRGTYKCGSTPGTFILRWALDQAVSTGTVLAGSTLTYKRTN